MDYDLTVKTILIGDSSVGKSSLLYRYTDNDWNPYYIATIGVDFKVTTMERSNKVVKLQLWDTAGQERFRSITQSYYKGAHAVAVVFDVNDRESFEGLKLWINDVKNFGTTNVPIVMLGNKCDLCSDEVASSNDRPLVRRAVPEAEARQFAEAHGLRYFDVSAKTGANVQAAFDHIVDECVNQREKIGMNARSRNAGGVIIPNRDGQKTGQKKVDGNCAC